MNLQFLQALRGRSRTPEAPVENSGNSQRVGRDVVFAEMERFQLDAVPVRSTAGLRDGGEGGLTGSWVYTAVRARVLLATSHTSYFPEAQRPPATALRIERFRITEGHPAHLVFWDFASSSQPRPSRSSYWLKLRLKCNERSQARPNDHQRTLRHFRRWASFHFSPSAGLPRRAGYRRR